jgi:hypothetical protein
MKVPIMTGTAMKAITTVFHPTAFDSVISFHPECGLAANI